MASQFNFAFINMGCYFRREEQGMPTSRRQANFIFIISSLLSFLQIKSQGKDDSPFQTHPITVNIAATSLLVYGLAREVEQRYSWARPSWMMYANVDVVRSVMRVFGSMTLASLASILFPDWVLPVLYVLYMLPLAGELVKWLKRRIVGGNGGRDILVTSRDMGRFLNGQRRLEEGRFREERERVTV